MSGDRIEKSLSSSGELLVVGTPKGIARRSESAARERCTDRIGIVGPSRTWILVFSGFRGDVVWIGA
jgi:hypothetical protein